MNSSFDCGVCPHYFCSMGILSAIGLCPMCRTIGELRESHILPRWIYKATNLINSPDGVNLSYNTKTNERSTSAIKGDGLKQENYLCDYCERLLNNKYENYSGGIFFNVDYSTNNGLFEHFPDRTFNMGYALRKNVDYTKLKLYFLSIIYRASNTTLVEFEHIKLHAKDNERIREMILNGDAGHETEYPISILIPDTYNDSDLQQIVPLRQLPGHDNYGYFYFLSFGLYLFYIKMSMGVSFAGFELKKFDDWLNKYRLSMDNKVYYVKLTRYHWMKTIKTHMGEELYQQRICEQKEKSQQTL